MSKKKTYIYIVLILILFVSILILTVIASIDFGKMVVYGLYIESVYKANDHFYNVFKLILEMQDILDSIARPNKELSKLSNLLAKTSSYLQDHYAYKAILYFDFIEEHLPDLLVVLIIFLIVLIIALFIIFCREYIRLSKKTKKWQ